MKIFDCFMYFDEEVVLDLRLNMLNDYVDYFIIVESTFTHRGDKRKLRFNLEKFKKFEKKIVYLVYDESPSNIEEVLSDDNHDEKSRKYRIFRLSRSPTSPNRSGQTCSGGSRAAQTCFFDRTSSERKTVLRNFEKTFSKKSYTDFSKKYMIFSEPYLGAPKVLPVVEMAAPAIYPRTSLFPHLFGHFFSKFRRF